MRHYLALVLILIATYAFALSPEDYYPMAIGNSWTMEDSSESGISTMTTTVIGTEMFMGHETWLIGSSGASGVDTMYYQFRPDGLYGLNFADTSYIMELLFMPSSFDIGDSWIVFSQDSSWIEGGMDYEQNLTYTNTAIAMEDVTVPAGIFADCLKMSMEGSITTLVTLAGDTMYYGRSSFGNHSWMAEDIGAVKSLGWNFNGTDTSWSSSELIDYSVSNISEDVRKPNNAAIHTWPNPFNSACRIATPAGVEVEIFDVTGRLVETLPASEEIVRSWTPSADVPGGVYLVRATVGEEKITSKVLLVK